MDDKALVRAFNLTISVREDISEECIKAVKKWLTKNTKYVHCVIERDTGKAHLHAGIFFNDVRDKKKMRENLWDRQVRPYHPTSIGRVAVNIHAAPGRKWIDEYLHKEDNVEVILSDLPVDLHDLDEYYPSQEVQDMLLSAKEKTVDCFYAVHEVAYKEWLHENTWQSSTQTAHEYFGLRMFVRKDMRVIADSRRVHQMAVALHKYSTDSYKLTNLEISTHIKENCITDYA